ncbi:MAG: hypothetical protein ACI4I2_09895 [Oscillospiraceae bacterium]
MLGYKGISAKLTSEVDRMLAEKLIVKVMDGNRVKLGLENVNYGDGKICDANKPIYLLINKINCPR